MYIFEEGPHGLSLATQASSVSQLQVAKWMDLVEKWLEKRFRLPLKKYKINGLLPKSCVGNT